MKAKGPKSDGPAGLRCPACGGTDVVSSLPRNFWDEVMRAWNRVPKHCRTCGRRFHAVERSRRPA